MLYDREVPFEMRAEGGGAAGGAGRELVGSMEGIKVKILTMGDEFALQQIRVELSSENDLFFHFTHALEEASYVAVQEHQKLMASFNECAPRAPAPRAPRSAHGDAPRAFAGTRTS